MKSNGYEKFFNQAKKNALNSEGSFANQKKYQVINKTKPKKNLRTFPVIQFCLFFICAISLFLAIENFDNIESYLSKIELSFSTAKAEEIATPTKSEVKTEELPVEPTTGSVTKQVQNSEQVSGSSSVVQDSDYLFNLSERKKELDQREAELDKKAAEIEAQKLVIEADLKKLEESRLKISEMLKERIKADDSKIENLVQVYTNMKPSQAAKIFETMDEDLVIEILARMKKKNAADILNLIKTEKAQLFAEKYSGYRVPATQSKNEDKIDTDSKTKNNSEQPKTDSETN